MRKYACIIFFETSVQVTDSTRVINTSQLFFVSSYNIYEITVSFIVYIVHNLFLYLINKASKKDTRISKYSKIP